VGAFNPTDASNAAAARMGDLTRPDSAIVTATGKVGAALHLVITAAMRCSGEHSSTY
jgi:hypothetical protein